MKIVMYTGLVTLLCLSEPDAQVVSARKISQASGNFAGLLGDEGHFGDALAAIGDLDGDGVEDIAVGNAGADDGGIDQGALWILFLTASGEVKAHQRISATHGGFTGDLDDLDAFGRSVACLGDLDGDGVADLAVGAPGDDDAGPSRGALWILFLHDDGKVKAYQKISRSSGGFTGGLSDRDAFGHSVACLGDRDGDSVPDVAVGAPRDDDGGSDGRRSDTGSVWILFMRPDGTVKAHQKISPTMGGFGGSLHDGSAFGWSLASLDDIDGDGQRDLAVGGPDEDPSLTNWPGQNETEIGSGFLPPGFEPSGAAWHAGRSRLLIVDDRGDIVAVKRDGSDAVFWSLGGDLEAVCVDDPQSDRVYLGLEHPDTIVEFDLASGQATGNFWDLTPWMSGLDTEGLEGLASGNGLFYAAHQGEGAIYVFRLRPLGVAVLVDVIASPLGLDDLSALHFDQDTDVLCAFYDGAQTLVEMTADGTYLRHYLLDGGSQEGLTVIADCDTETAEIFVVEDEGPVRRWDGYPAPCRQEGLHPSAGELWLLSLDAASQVIDQRRVSNAEIGTLSEGDFFGSAAAFMGDVDGDGHPEVAVGARGDSSVGPRRGAAYFLSLRDGEVDSVSRFAPGSDCAPWLVRDHDHFGHALAMNAGARLWVGANHDDDGGPNRGALWGLETTDRELSLILEPPEVPIGDSLQIDSCRGLSSSLSGLFFVRFNDTPFFMLVATIPYDATGTWHLEASTPNDPSLVGNSITLRVLGMGANGSLVSSNDRETLFQ